MMIPLRLTSYLIFDREVIGIIIIIISRVTANKGPGIARIGTIRWVCICVSHRNLRVWTEFINLDLEKLC